MAKIVNLVCEVCLSRNYHVPKNGGLTERLTLKKYCPKCNRTTVHKETR